MILVTGAAGFIGSHACVELLNAGYEIVTVDNLSNSKREAINRVKQITKRDFLFYPIDLLDKEALEKVFIENKIKAVIHFAGLKAVGESTEKPLMYYYNNIVGTIILCELMTKYKIKRIVFSSSATVYGMPDQVPISENSPLRAMNPYGRTKLMIEEILRDLYLSDKSWSISILRYFNPVGAHPSGTIGEDPNGIPSNLMPFITQVAIGKLNQLKVFGNDYETIDGTGIRDYIHVVDLAKGHLKALEVVMNTFGVKVFNLGTGSGYSVLQIIETFEKVTKKSVPYQIVERRQGDVAAIYADTNKAKDELGWVATKGLEEMCIDSWRWQVNNPKGYI
ncbi:UDP-glucose 4-epimerase GalE [Alkalihalobacterium alkalinitrilicum]|uniref:UDP-glucose 4-epimerase GalE n=1 Tax=Alkalihalobacterium alkalinitrilicum TaxID=427920 RepID=UPI000994BED7|nr:UDP-glucose 4-epimerase GalE [Alkalihalobacterium alkalinitrilicum]